MAARLSWRSYARYALYENETCHQRRTFSSAAIRVISRHGRSASPSTPSIPDWRSRDGDPGRGPYSRLSAGRDSCTAMAPSTARSDRANRRDRRALTTSATNTEEVKPVADKVAEGLVVSSDSDGEGKSESSQEAPKRSEPPRSLHEYAQRKGTLSVTDIVSPLWCEFQTQYNVLGQSHLPISQRPTEIVTPAGNVVRPSLGLTQKREKILVAGRQTHERLEREVFPFQVRVSASTREEAWALKILQMITGLMTLMRDGCTRELPVFGFVGGTLVNGIIDEISQRPLPRHLLRFLDAPRETAKTGPKLDDCFGKPVAATQESSSIASASKSAASGKRWASQEEWKKDQTRKARSQPSPSQAKRTSPRKVAKITKVDGSQARLASFLAPDSQVSEATQGQSTQQKNESFERFGFFIEDSKTRKKGFAPDVQDQKPSRLQCMLYKRLIDGLLFHTGQVAGTFPPERAREARILGLDDFAEPTSAARVCEHLKLDVQAAMSDEFMEGAAQLTEGYEMALHISKEDQSPYCNLEHLSQILDSTLRQLSERARHGLGWSEEHTGVTGAMQEQLFLTYRRRKKSSRPKDGKTNDSKARRATATATATDSQPGEDSQMAAAVSSSLGMDQPPSSSPPDGSQDGSTIPSSSPVQVTDASTAVKSDKDIIARVRFVHSPRMLEAHIRDVLALWRGERDLRGVSLRDSWRCWPCAFRDDCEWREAKGRERLDEAAQDRIARVGNLSGSGSGSKSNGQKTASAAPGAAAVAVAFAMAEGEGDTAADEDDQADSAGSSDEEEKPAEVIDEDDQLWSQFDEIPNDLAW